MWCKFGKCVPVPVCGNTVVEPENGEACDDGNLVPGDGCDPKCKVEPPPAAVGTLVLSNGTDIISLLNAQGAVVDSITYDATWPWGNGGSMYVKDGCLDTLLNDSKDCWPGATSACAYGQYYSKESASLASCAVTACTTSGEACSDVPECGAAGASCKQRVFKDRGTPGAPNGCP